VHDRGRLLRPGPLGVMTGSLERYAGLPLSSIETGRAQQGQSLSAQASAPM
jgi:hypothetical protein